MMLFVSRRGEGACRTARSRPRRGSPLNRYSLCARQEIHISAEDLSSFKLASIEPSTVLAVLALLANIVALAIVLHQTRLTRRAVAHTEASAQDMRKRMFLDLLPESGPLIHVMNSFDRWERDMESFGRACDAVVERGDLGLLREIARKAPRSPHGTLDNFTYRHAPTWLKAIYVAGGQHYYGAVGVLATLWNFEQDRPTWGVEIDMGAGRTATQGIEDHLANLRELRALLDDTMPAAFLNAPAHLDDFDLLREGYREKGA